MKDEGKRKTQFINELIEVRQRVTELEASETERSRVQEDEYGAAAVIEGMLEAVAILDLDGTIRQVNREFERGWG